MPKRNTLDDLTFFWDKVDKTKTCWNWTGGSKRAGWHGTVKVSGVDWQTHRLSWHVHTGAIPKGMFVLHKCDNPKCVNPKHLFLGTQADNVKDMLVKGRGKAPTRDKHPNTKIPESDIPKVIHLWQSGITQRAIGKLYGATDVAVSHLLKKLGVQRWT